MQGKEGREEENMGVNRAGEEGAEGEGRRGGGREVSCGAAG